MNNKWIDIKERLPKRDRDKDILVYSETKGYIDVATFEVFTDEKVPQFFPNAYEYRQGSDITHWMPLPKPPNVK